MGCKKISWEKYKNNMGAAVAIISIFSTPVFASVTEASFYGAGEKLNRETANGEIFNPRAQTCAHRTLPFGTLLKVTNPENGTWYECRVNDRGPAAWTGRGIDLTPKGFQLLGIPTEKGTALVRVERKQSGPAN